MSSTSRLEFKLKCQQLLAEPDNLMNEIPLEHSDFQTSEAFFYSAYSSLTLTVEKLMVFT